MATVRYTLRDSVAVIEFSNPPLNSFNYALRRDVMAAVERANVDVNVRAVVLFGTGGVFSAGSDVHEMATLQAARGPALPELVRALESSSKPVVAAIEGDCLGGGLQLTLGCHYRVADQDARLGLPEVKLGLLPSAGGTQRLPRLCGLPVALKMIVTGDILPAAELARTPLLDRVVTEDTLEAAVDFAASIIIEGRELPRTRDRPVNDRNAKLIFDQARLRTKQAHKGMVAPMRAIDAIEAAITQTFDEGIRVERTLFKQLHDGTESRALRHFFLAKHAAGKIADVPDSTPTRPISLAAVIGAGSLAIGIAICFLDAGIPVKLLEAGEDALERSCARIHDHYEQLVKQGQQTQEQCDEKLALLMPSQSYAEISDADIVVEAVFEEITIKQHVFATLDRTMKRGAILVTSTSTLDIGRIARATQRTCDVVGMHFLGPPNAMKLIEVVRCDETADDVLTTVVRLARRLKKVAVVARARAGFIGNRMLSQYLDQALLLVEEGAAPRTVDEAIENFGFTQGPFRAGDIDGDEVARPSSVVADLIRSFRQQHGNPPRRIEEGEIIDRLVLALVNEGARILEERVAERTSDIDLVSLTVHGFPTWRGGPLFHADLVGIDRIVKRMQEFADNPRANPEFWRPPFLLLRLAADGKTFRSLDRPFAL
jgi:3-hydroxyacyl-CoA dehydrogenase